MNGRETWEDKKKNIRGIRIDTFNIAMIIIMCAFYLMLTVQTLDVYRSYIDLENTMQNYISCNQMAEQVRDGSDYLTEKVRYYAQTGKEQYLQDYLKELTETKNRDHAMTELLRISKSEFLEEETEESLKLSNELVDIECYSMKLTALANGKSLQDMPKQLKDIELTAEDRMLSKKEMEEKGRALVFGDEYQEYKEHINEHLDLAVDNILTQTNAKFDASSENMNKSLKENRLWLGILFFMNIVMFAFIMILIIRPLKIYIGNIENDTLFDIVGSYEFKFLALTYNSIYEVNAANKQNLQYSAEHDKLTGVLNRTAFEGMKPYLSVNSVPIAFLLVDVDCFKRVNDTYGHDTGDIVLKKVAKLLMNHTRANDRVIRYGGDEFVIIMTDMTKENAHVITRKIEEINDILKYPSDGLPEVTVSVGVAFSMEGFNEELLKKADEALYRVKNNGRCGIEFSE